MNICNQDLENIEKITSLVTAIIITNQDNYYQTITTEYKSQTVSNIHTISQISLIEGTYVQPQNPFVFLLKFEVIGQMQIVKTVEDKVEIIKEYELGTEIK